MANQDDELTDPVAVINLKVKKNNNNNKACILIFGLSVFFFFVRLLIAFHD